MAYLTIALMGDDQLLRLRVAACAAREGAARDGVDPDAWAHSWRRDWAAAPNWDTTWESALASGIPSTEIGGRADVITDGMILSSVQPMKPFRLVGEAPVQPTKQSEAAYLTSPQLLTTDWAEVLTLDMPGAGVWGISGIWTGNSTTTSAEFRTDGGEGIRLEPKDGADRNLVSLTGVVDTPGPLVVEARKSVAAGVFMVRSMTAWWIAAS